MPFHGYAAYNPGDILQPFDFDPTPLGPDDVEIKITHCGLCHSDIHVMDGDWGTHHPAVPGHEVVGTVSALGPHVTHLQMGQRVGVGWQSGSCMQCEWCIRGDVHLCPEFVTTCMGRHGGFADRIRTDARFTHPIPEALSSADAAPLLCAGITVYNPLANFGVRPSDRVGVIGIGGLGHLALQFANKFGCEVTAFSTTAEKEAEARSFGAHRFIINTNAEHMKAARNSVDFIISTVNVNLAWKNYMQILRPNGTLCLVGAVAGEISVSSGYFTAQQKSMRGGSIGSRATMREMLDFATRHNIKAKTEILPMAQVNTAIQKVRQNKARYRMVLQN